VSSLPIFIAGRFAVHKLFHARGMGDVYIGRDTQNGRRVAVKVFAPRWLRFERDRDRFFEELRTRVEHPAIVHPLDAAPLPGGRAYVTTPWIAGKDLSEVLPSTPMDPREVTALLAPIASALDALHEAGIVHRTLGDAKIRLTSELEHPVVLTGVGAAALLAGGRRRQNSAVTSPTSIDYVAPEVDPEVAPDRRADVYALGVLAFRMLSGRLPFPTRDCVERALSDRRTEDSPSLGASGSFSPALETAVACALACDPGVRFAKAGLFLEAMRAAIDAPLEVANEETDAVVRKLLELGPRRRELDTLDAAPRFVLPRFAEPMPIHIRRVLVATLGGSETTRWSAVAVIVTLAVWTLLMFTTLR
jgi:serine/threonine-protein kinase